MNEDTPDLFQISVFTNADNSTGHNISNPLSLFADDIILGNNAYQYIVIVDNR